MCFVFFKQKTAYEMRISDWSSDVCSSDLLGGKSPFIVFEDADLDAAAEGLVDSIWFNQGQVCCAGSRLLVQESVEQRFLAKVRARMGHLIVGSDRKTVVSGKSVSVRVHLGGSRIINKKSHNKSHTS